MTTHRRECPRALEHIRKRESMVMMVHGKVRTLHGDLDVTRETVSPERHVTSLKAAGHDPVCVQQLGTKYYVVGRYTAGHDSAIDAFVCEMNRRPVNAVTRGDRR